MKGLTLILLVSFSSACVYPGFYHERFAGRVVDESGKAIPGADIYLGIDKDCATVGGSVSQQMKEVRTRTDRNGNFSVSATGWGMLNFFLLSGCGGFERMLQICRDGVGVIAYHSRPGWDEFPPQRNKDGDFVFNGIAKRCR